MSLRRTVIATLAALSLGAPLLAFAQADYPARPIRMVVPFGPGTTTDIIARIFGEAMGKALGQVIVVDNKSGAGGNIGADAVAKAPADGYTIVMGTVGTHAINPGLYRHMPYDAQKDFAPIGFAGYTPTLVVVAANSPYKSLKDLQAQAAKPGGISFASAGNGTSGHLAGELLKARLGGEMVHVPYKEGGMALSDVIAGQTQFMFYHPAAVMPQIKAGKLRALGVSSAKRTSAAPDVPTISSRASATSTWSPGSCSTRPRRRRHRCSPGCAKRWCRRCPTPVMHSQAKVDTKNSERGPLLLISGTKDHTVPDVVTRSTFKQYRDSTAVTELRQFEGRGHSLTVDSRLEGRRGSRARLA